MKLIASLALLGACTLLVHWWVGLFDNIYVAGAIGLAVIFTYAVIYDRVQASKRR